VSVRNVGLQVIIVGILLGWMIWWQRFGVLLIESGLGRHENRIGTLCHATDNGVYRLHKYGHSLALVIASKYTWKEIRTISPGMHNNGGDGQVARTGLPKLCASPTIRMKYGVNGLGGLAGKQSFNCDFPIRKHPLKTLRRRQSEVSPLLSS